MCTYWGAIELLLGFVLGFDGSLGLIHGFGGLFDVTAVSCCECQREFWMDRLRERRLCLCNRFIFGQALFVTRLCMSHESHWQGQ